MPDEPRVPLLRVATPASWVQLDLDPRTRAASIQRLVEEAAEAFPEAAQFGPYVPEDDGDRRVRRKETDVRARQKKRKRRSRNRG